MAEEIEKIKISELPEEGTTLEGFYTIGTKQEGGVLKSKKVNLGFVQTAANNANSAAETATTAAGKANEAADKFNAAIVQETGDAQDKVISQHGVTEAINGITDTLTDYAHKGEVRHIERDLGMYPELEPVPLNSEVTGKYINSDGKYVDASGWNVASIGAVSLGNTYLLNMVSSANMVLGVALFVSRVYKRDKEGKIIGTTLTPLFSAKNTSIPASGYVLFEAMDDYEEVLICYKPELTTQMLVARWGFKASHATQLRNLRLIVDNKTDFEGIYELLTAGYALNLVGKGNGEPQAFMSRKTGGGNITDGSAVIKEVDGVQPIVWNQLNNIPFALGYWKTIKGTMSMDEGLLCLTFDGDYEQGYNQGINAVFRDVIDGHIYAIAYKVKSSYNCRFGGDFGDVAYGYDFPIIPANTWGESAVVLTSKKRGGGIFLCSRMNVITGQKVWFKDLSVSDLTQMFGAGNEPSTYEEYLNRISHYHIADEYAYNAGEVVNYKGTGIKTTNVDGTKSYVRDWREVMKKYFPDGMTSLNGVKDFFNERKAVRKFGVVDLGSLSYVKGGNVWISLIPDYKTNTPNRYVNAFTTKYTQTIADNEISSVDCPNLKFYANAGGQEGGIGIRDDAYTTAESFKAAMAGVLLFYELAEPVEDIFDKPLNLTYTVINGGTETSLATENSTQFEGSIAYNKDYVAVVDELQMQNRVTQIELENWEN